MLQLYYMISVIISNPPIAVKCAPCVDICLMPPENHRFHKVQKRRVKNNLFPHAFFRSFSVRNNGFSLSSSDDSLTMLLGQMPGYDTVLVKNVMSDYLSGTTVISSEKQLAADRLCTG